VSRPLSLQVWGLENALLFVNNTTLEHYTAFNAA